MLNSTIKQCEITQVSTTDDLFSRSCLQSYCLAIKPQFVAKSDCVGSHDTAVAGLFFFNGNDKQSYDKQPKAHALQFIIAYTIGKKNSNTSSFKT